MSGEVRSTSSTGGEKGVKQERFDLIPTGPLTELARLYGRGALKYADHNWMRGYEWSKSYAALQRHANLFWGGQDLDSCEADCPPDCANHTGLPHMAAVAWHAFALLEFMERHPDFDNRPVS